MDKDELRVCIVYIYRPYKRVQSFMTFVAQYTRDNRIKDTSEGQRMIYSFFPFLLSHRLILRKRKKNIVRVKKNEFFFTLICVLRWFIVAVYCRELFNNFFCETSFIIHNCAHGKSEKRE